MIQVNCKKSRQHGKNCQIYGLKRSTAFTLAEILITLGIIGVVAALSIPTLLNSSQDQEHTVALKTFYSELSQAVATLQSPDTSYNFIGSSGYSIMNNLCTILSCVQTDTVNNIFGNISSSLMQNYVSYKSSSLAFTNLVNTDYGAKLKNGMYIAVNAYNPSRSSFQLLVDTNGDKKPNMFGKDLNLFEVSLLSNGKVVPLAAGSPNSPYASGWRGHACVANSSGTNDVWPCSYYRLFKANLMP